VASIPTVRGTVVRCLRGSIWLTQEGQWRDYILIAGVSYVSRDSGKIVLSSPDTQSTVSITRIDLALADGAGEPSLRLDAGAVARIEHAARRAQAAEITWVAGRLRDALSGAWRSITGQR